MNEFLSFRLFYPLISHLLSHGQISHAPSCMSRDSISCTLQVDNAFPLLCPPPAVLLCLCSYFSLWGFCVSGLEATLPAWILCFFFYWFIPSYRVSLRHVVTSTPSLPFPKVSSGWDPHWLLTSQQPLLLHSILCNAATLTFSQPQLIMLLLSNKPQISQVSILTTE